MRFEIQQNAAANLPEKEIKERKYDIKTLIKELAENFKREGYPVTDDCRVDMLVYAEKRIFNPALVKADMVMVEGLQKKWQQESEDEGEKLKIGTKFEILKTVLFNKFLGKDFVVVRSSLYDDIKNKVDNIILDKRTGGVICAFDEVADTLGTRYEEKIDRVLGRNRSGVYIKYGFQITEGRLILTSVEKIPIFYLALNEGKVEEGIKNLTPLEEKSNYEKKLWFYFCNCLVDQVKRLFKYTQDPIIVSRATMFKSEIARFLQELAREIRV